MGDMFIDTILGRYSLANRFLSFFLPFLHQFNCHPFSTIHSILYANSVIHFNNLKPLNSDLFLRFLTFKITFIIKAKAIINKFLELILLTPLQYNYVSLKKIFFSNTNFLHIIVILAITSLLKICSPKYPQLSFCTNSFRYN